MQAVLKPQNSIYKVKFSAAAATQSTYVVFIKDLSNALLVHGSAAQGIPVLPSPRDMQQTDLHRYVMVELFGGGKTVSLVLDATNVYLLGYRPGDGTDSYYFKDVPQVVRNLFFQGTTRNVLDFDGSYGSLQRKAGVADRNEIPLGFQELRQKIQNMNSYTPRADVGRVAKALIVCIEMVSEAARFKYIQQKIAQLAPVVQGGPETMLYPDALMEGYQNNWGQLSEAVQRAGPNGTFIKNVIVAGITYSNVSSVRPVIAILLKLSSTACFATGIPGQLFDQTLCQI